MTLPTKRNLSQTEGQDNEPSAFRSITKKSSAGIANSAPAPAPAKIPTSFYQHRANSFAPVFQVIPLAQGSAVQAYPVNQDSHEVQGFLPAQALSLPTPHHSSQLPPPNNPFQLQPIQHLPQPLPFQLSYTPHPQFSPLDQTLSQFSGQSQIPTRALTVAGSSKDLTEAKAEVEIRALNTASSLADQQALSIANNSPEKKSIEDKVGEITLLGLSALKELKDPKNITNLLLLINLFNAKDKISSKNDSQFEKIFSDNSSKIIVGNFNQKKSVFYVLENFDNLFKPLIETFPRRNLASMLFLSDEIKASKTLSELVLLIKTPQFKKLKDVLPSNYGSFISKTANGRQNPENFLSQILDNIDALKEIKEMGFNDYQISRIFYTSHFKIGENIKSFLENKEFIKEIIESKMDKDKNSNNVAYFLATIARVGFRELIPEFKELFKSSATDLLNQIEKNLNKPRTTIKDIKVELSKPGKGFDEKILAEIISKLEKKNTHFYDRTGCVAATMEKQQNEIISRILGRKYIYTYQTKKLIEHPAPPSAQTKTSAQRTEPVSASTTLEISGQ